MRRLLIAAAVTAASVLAFVGGPATASAEPLINLEIGNLVDIGVLSLLDD